MRPSRKIQDYLNQSFTNPSVAIAHDDSEWGGDAPARNSGSDGDDDETASAAIARPLRPQAPAERAEQPGNEGLAHWGSHFFSPAITGMARMQTAITFEVRPMP